MPTCGLLAQNQLKKFLAWCDTQGIEHRDGRGHHQVAQVKLPGQTGWHVLYYRDSNPVHYSVPWPLTSTVEKFLKDKKRANHHPATRQQETTEGPEPAQGAGDHQAEDDSAPF